MKHTAPRSALRCPRAIAVAPGALVLAGLLLALAGWPAAALADDARAREIMEAVQDRPDGDDAVADMEMILIDRNDNRRERRIRTFRKDFGADTHTIMFFREPADVRGTGFLTYDYDRAGKDDDQWLYLPALDKVKRISGTDKSGSFMGSDFNYSDMSEPDLDEYDLTLDGEAEVDGTATWRITSVPRSEDTAEETGYDRSVVWVRQDNHVIVRAVRFVHDSRERKFMQVTGLERIDGFWVETEMQMRTVRGRSTEHSTVLRRHNVRFDQGLDDDMFTVRRLEKGL